MMLAFPLSRCLTSMRVHQVDLQSIGARELDVALPAEVPSVPDVHLAVAPQIAAALECRIADETDARALCFQLVQLDVVAQVPCAGQAAQTETAFEYLGVTEMLRFDVLHEVRTIAVLAVAVLADVGTFLAVRASSEAASGLLDRRLLRSTS